MGLIKVTCFLIFVTSLMVFASCGTAPKTDTLHPSKTTPEIQVWYRFQDPMRGEGWASAANFMATQTGESLTVDLKANGVDMEGNTVDITPTWIPSDTTMVHVVPRIGPRVTLTVVREGQCSLLVATDSLSNRLSIRASTQGVRFRVYMSK